MTLEFRDRIVGLERVKTELLDAHPRNIRTHGDEQRSAMANVLEQIGWADATVARKQGDRYQVLDGHLRQEMADTVPVLVVDLDDDEADLFLATHDQLGSLAGIDAEQLRELTDGFELDLTQFGWPQAELDQLITPPLPEPDPEDDDTPSDPTDDLIAKWGTARGQLWLITHEQSSHALMCGDCTDEDDVKSLLGDEQISLCFTSPPYADQRTYEDGTDISVEHLVKFIEPAAKRCELLMWNLGVSRRDGKIIPYWDEYTAAAEAVGLKMVSWLVWDRENPQTVAQQTACFPICHEWIFAFAREVPELKPVIENRRAGDSYALGTIRQRDGTTKPTTSRAVVKNRRALGTVISGIDIERDSDSHPAQFPVALPERIIASVRGSVYDPFIGTGTTMVAASRLGRDSYGMEISPRYVAVCLERMSRIGATCERADD